MNRRKWSIGVQVALVVVLVVFVVTVIHTSTRYGATRADWAVFKAGVLLAACDVYRDHPQSGEKYPATLADLVKPPFGGSSFLKKGEEDLLDPWGRPFKYAVVPDGKGQLEVYVWAEQTVEGKLKLIGVKRTADGKTEVFGL